MSGDVRLLRSTPDTSPLFVSSSPMDDEPMVADAAYPDPHPHPASPKPSVSRGARACTVCRQAKVLLFFLLFFLLILPFQMKCVGAEDDGAKPCQRCRRSNLRYFSLSFFPFPFLIPVLDVSLKNTAAAENQAQSLPSFFPLTSLR